MVRIEELHPGVKVKIIDNLEPGIARDMYRFQGQILTIKEIIDNTCEYDNNRYHISLVEDSCKRWRLRDFEEVISDEDEFGDFDLPSIDELFE